MMANTFGNQSTQVRLVDPRAVRQARPRFGRDAIPELMLANSLYVPLSRRAARGWILLTRADFNRVSGYSTANTLQFDCFDKAAPAMTFRGLSIVQARSVSTGIIDDDGAAYLVELTDARGILSNQWFQFPTNSYYNVLAPAYPGTYYDASLNSGVAWTWTTMLQSLWNQMGTFLGAWPGLPSTPTSVPQDWSFPGVSAWDALCDVLEHLGMAVACDLTSSTPYTIVSPGSTDAAFDALTTKYANRLEDDLDWIDVGSGRVPGEVTVYFRRINQYYGTEETVRADSLQWATGSVYSVTKNAPSTFSGAAGTHGMYDDFRVRFDVDGNPLAADVTTADAIATAIQVKELALAGSEVVRITVNTPEAAKEVPA